MSCERPRQTPVVGPHRHGTGRDLPRVSGDHSDHPHRSLGVRNLRGKRCTAGGTTVVRPLHDLKRFRGHGKNADKQSYKTGVSAGFLGGAILVGIAALAIANPAGDDD